MGCVPSKNYCKRKSTSELESNISLKSELKLAVRLMIRKKVVESRFLSKLKKFETELGVIYESQQESEMS